MDQLLTVAEVQDRLRLGKTSLWTEILSGALPTVRPGPGGRRRLVRESDLERYLEAHSVGGEPNEHSTLPAPTMRRRKR